MDSNPDGTEPILAEQVKATCDLLVDLADEVDDALLTAPAAVLAETIAAELAARGVAASTEAVRGVFDDADQVTLLSAQMVAAVRRDARMAAAVDERVEENADALVIETSILAVAALVVLALRIKEVRWGVGGGRITFEPASQAVVEFFRGLFGGA